MLNDRTSGLWCRSDNTWYYLETGPHLQANPIRRVKSTLISRGKIKYDIGGVKRNQEPYILMSHDEAKEKGCEIKAIFLNAHIQKVFEAEQQNKAVDSPWG